MYICYLKGFVGDALQISCILVFALFGTLLFCKRTPICRCKISFNGSIYYVLHLQILRFYIHVVRQFYIQVSLLNHIALACYVMRDLANVPSFISGLLSFINSPLYVPFTEISQGPVIMPLNNELCYTHA